MNHFIGISRFNPDVRVDNGGTTGANVPFDNGASRHVDLSIHAVPPRQRIAGNCAAAAAKAGIHGVNPLASRPRSAAKDGCAGMPGLTWPRILFRWRQIHGILSFMNDMNIRFKLVNLLPGCA